MSDNTIDVDIKFHLNDIDELFKKVSGGNDIMDELKGKEGDMKSSLYYDFEMTEDKGKLLDVINKLSITAHDMDDVYKMIADMNADQGDQSTIIERTEKSMITLLTLSKVMLKMFEDRFPITSDIQDNLDEMNDILSNKNLDLDDKVDKLLRSINTIFAPLKEELPAAFKISGDPSLLSGSDDKSRAMRYQVQDFVSQTSTLLEKFIADSKKKTRPRLGELEPELQNLLSIAQMLDETLDDVKGKAVDLDIKTLEQTMTEGQTIHRLFDSPDSKRTFAKMEETMQGILEIFKQLTEDTASHLANIESDFDGMIEAMNVSEDKVTEAVKILIDVRAKLFGTIIDIKKTVRDEVGKIQDVLHEDLYIGTITDIWEQLVKRELVTPVSASAQHKTLDYMLRLAEASINTLAGDLDRLMRGKTEEELFDLGLTDLNAIKGLIALIQTKKAGFENLTDVVFPEYADHKEEFKYFDLTNVQAMIQTIATRTGEQDKFLQKLSSQFTTLLTAVNSTRKEAEKAGTIVSGYDRTINKAVNELTQASNQLLSNKQKTDITFDKMKELIKDYNELMKGITGKEISDPEEPDK